MALAEINLDVCIPEGKTWLARVTGLGGKYGIEREFLGPIARNLSDSGKTGDAIYAVPDGIYESNEGRRRLGRKFWHVVDGHPDEINREQMIKIMEATERGEI